MGFLLVILVLALAIAGGFLGDLLEVAAWMLVVLVVVGAAAGALLYQAVKSLFRR